MWGYPCGIHGSAQYKWPWTKDNPTQGLSETGKTWLTNQLMDWRIDQRPPAEKSIHRHNSRRSLLQPALRAVFCSNCYSRAFDCDLITFLSPSALRPPPVYGHSLHTLAVCGVHACNPTVHPWQQFSSGLANRLTILPHTLPILVFFFPVWCEQCVEKRMQLCKHSPTQEPLTQSLILPPRLIKFRIYHRLDIYCHPKCFIRS